MSLQTYNKLLDIENRMFAYDPKTGNLTPPTEPRPVGMAMEFQVNIKVLSGRDKYKVKPSTFTIVGWNEDLNSTLIHDENDIAKGLYGIIEAGSVMASNIAKLSKGVIVGFFAKLGKYRQDEMPINVPTGDNSYCSLILDNNATSNYGSDECDRNEKLPYKSGSTRVTIPWLRDDYSRQDVKDSFDDWSYEEPTFGYTYTLGQVKFANEAFTELMAIPTNYVHSVKAVERSVNLGEIKVNNDSAIGMINDEVLSEKYENITDGIDDPITTNSNNQTNP